MHSNTLLCLQNSSLPYRLAVMIPTATGAAHSCLCLWILAVSLYDVAIVIYQFIMMRTYMSRTQFL